MIQNIKMDTQQLLNKIEELEGEMKLMKAASTIPFDVEQALRERLRLATFKSIILSSKGATTENQAVDEGGLSTYSVLKPPDAFVEVVISNTTYYLPVYT